MALDRKGLFCSLLGEGLSVQVRLLVLGREVREELPSGELPPTLEYTEQLTKPTRMTLDSLVMATSQLRG